MYILFFNERHPYGFFAAGAGFLCAHTRKKNLYKARFVSMDTTYVNSGEKDGLKHT